MRLASSIKFKTSVYLIFSSWHTYLNFADCIFSSGCYRNAAKVGDNNETRRRHMQSVMNPKHTCAFISLNASFVGPLQSCGMELKPTFPTILSAGSAILTSELRENSSKNRCSWRLFRRLTMALKSSGVLEDDSNEKSCDLLQTGLRCDGGKRKHTRIYTLIPPT